jgi:hypothetical protein
VSAWGPVVGTGEVFLWGCLGGLFLEFLGLILLIRRRQEGDNFTMPERVKTFAFWFGVGGSGLIGGVLPWLQVASEIVKIGGSHILSFQLGLAWPALLAVVSQKTESGPPGTVNPPIGQAGPQSGGPGPGPPGTVG